MSELKTLIFDLGGVVLSEDDSVLFQSDFLNTFNINASTVAEGWRAGWNDFKIGKITENMFWDILLKTAGAHPIDITKAKNLWRNHAYENDHMFSLLKNLQKYYTLGVLSNIGKEHFDYKWKHFNLDRYFTFFVASGYEAIAKPDLAIYELLLKKIGIPSQECLFIDNLERNLLPAKQLGMKTILFQTQNKLETQLRSMGIRYE
jgi:FMN phosphatase YigB (HAD superfamily)